MLFTTQILSNYPVQNTAIFNSKAIDEAYKKSETLSDTVSVPSLIPHQMKNGKNVYSSHYSANGVRNKKGDQSSKYRNKGREVLSENHEKSGTSEEKKKSEEYSKDEGDRYSKYYKGGKSHKGAKFGEKKGHKKGHKTKGYHNTFHKDEVHVIHKFYDDYHRSGYYSKYGGKHDEYSKREGGKKKGSRHREGTSQSGYGKEKIREKLKNDKESKGFTDKRGHENHHKTYEDFRKDDGKNKKQTYTFVV